MADEFDLSDCPHCGGIAAVEICREPVYVDRGDENDAFYVCCSMFRGGCGARGGYRKHKADAVSVWNCRDTKDAA